MQDYPELPSLCFFALLFPAVTQKKPQYTASGGKEEGWKTGAADAVNENSTPACQGITASPTLHQPVQHLSTVAHRHPRI